MATLKDKANDIQIAFEDAFGKSLGSRRLNSRACNMYQGAVSEQDGTNNIIVEMFFDIPKLVIALEKFDLNRSELDKLEPNQLQTITLKDQRFEPFRKVYGSAKVQCAVLDSGKVRFTIYGNPEKIKLVRKALELTFTEFREREQVYTITNSKWFISTDAARIAVAKKLGAVVKDNDQGDDATVSEAIIVKPGNGNLTQYVYDIQRAISASDFEMDGLITPMTEQLRHKRTKVQPGEFRFNITKDALKTLAKIDEHKFAKLQAGSSLSR